ncbi:MAG: S8 family serine peptidase [Planctomycetota bacterium]|nr:S8 family serine peptidase [Planctomycetota bacterium]
MTLKRGIVVAVTLLALAGASGAANTGLKPRQPIPKSPAALLRVPLDATGRLIIKFSDGARARLELDGHVYSLTNRSMNRANAIIDRFGLTLSPAINHPPEKLAALEQRAAAYSGKAQPDFAGLMHIEGPQEALLPAARALYALDTVEYVQFETVRYLADGAPGPHYAPGGGRLLDGACCIPNEDETVFTCTVDSSINCVNAGGIYQGDGTVCGDDGCKACCLEDGSCEVMVEGNCNNNGGNFVPSEPNCDDVDCDDTDCGDPGAGKCFDDTNNNVSCDDLECCELVCGIDPWCCDDENEDARWDDFCVAEANMYCAGHVADGNPDDPDRCSTPMNHSCFISGGGGCNNEACCEAVCLLDPTCCTGIWGPSCVAIAYDAGACTTLDPDADTPDLTPLQGYRTLSSYLSQILNGDIPAEFLAFVPDTFLYSGEAGGYGSGYGGEGWELFDEDDPHAGMYGLGQFLVDVLGIDRIGEGNLCRGKTINVAVIEWSCYPDHEDLDVIVEDGQTLVQEPEWLTDPDHGTACLGIINAQENDFGVTGIAPDAQAWFFPLVSEEEGPRELNAWFSALDTLGPGDVISASYGPTGTLNTDETMSGVVDFATDLGISVCMSAGNDCDDLSQFEDQGETGGTVVGACSPGFPYYRRANSNYYTTGTLGVNSNVVHMAAWGDAVATTGYGDLWGSDTDEAYTYSFSDTSAAAPQIAGLTACLQGLAKQFYGIPLSATTIRRALNVGCPNAGCSQGNYSGGGIRFIGGYEDPDGDGCGLDSDRELGPFYIGPQEGGDRLIFPRLVGDPSAARAILTQDWAGFTDAPLIDDIVILKGEKIFGNLFSVKGDDQNYLVIEAVFTNRSDSPDPPGGGGGGGGGGGEGGGEGGGVGWLPEMGQVNYLATGDITDLAIVAHARESTVNSMGLETQVRYPGFFTLVFFEAYDWQAGRWEFSSVEFLNGESTEGPDTLLTTTPFSPTQRFVRDGDDRILFRMWTLGFGLGSGGLGNSGEDVGTYRYWIDLVNLDTSDQFGEELP